VFADDPNGPEEPTPEPTEDPTEGIAPVDGPTKNLEAIAGYYEVGLPEVQQLFEGGVGLGVIVKLYALTQELGLSPQEMLEIKQSGNGWGQFIGMSKVSDREARKSANLGQIKKSGFTGDRGDGTGVVIQESEEPAPDQLQAQESAKRQNQHKEKNEKGKGSQGGNGKGGDKKK
jgi:hypothetical protein